MWTIAWILWSCAAEPIGGDLAATQVGEEGTGTDTGESGCVGTPGPADVLSDGRTVEEALAAVTEAVTLDATWFDGRPAEVALAVAVADLAWDGGCDVFADVEVTVDVDQGALHLAGPGEVTLPAATLWLQAPGGGRFDPAALHDPACDGDYVLDAQRASGGWTGVLVHACAADEAVVLAFPAAG
ncbi:MAG: hypothetical protein R3F59_17455 [Myxococcota bacterium]